jgi:hypothetical protein
MKTLTTTLTLVALIALGAFASGAKAQASEIGVHGHWKLSIYNSDWTLERSLEFDNALAELGKQMLARLLTREASFGYWGVEVVQLPTGLCTNSSGFMGQCAMVEPISPDAEDGFIYKNLQVSYANSAPYSITLSGFFRATGPGPALQIDEVNTFIAYCPGTSPSGCSGQSLSGSTFTSKTLSSPVSVSPNQFVEVTVTLTFGTAP